MKIIGCTKLDGRTIDDVIETMVLYFENAAYFHLSPALILEGLYDKAPYDASFFTEKANRLDFAIERNLEFEKEMKEKNSKDSNNNSGNNGNAKKDELVTDINGKTVYKVYATETTMHFTGSFTGSGHFSIEVLNSNQDLYNLVANEIGDHKVDKTVSVTPGSMYYIQIETTRGQWDISWTGTGGA